MKQYVLTCDAKCDTEPFAVSMDTAIEMIKAKGGSGEMFPLPSGWLSLNMGGEWYHFCCTDCMQSFLAAKEEEARINEQMAAEAEDQQNREESAEFLRDLATRVERGETNFYGQVYELPGPNSPAIIEANKDQAERDDVADALRKVADTVSNESIEAAVVVANENGIALVIPRQGEFSAQGIIEDGPEGRTADTVPETVSE